MWPDWAIYCTLGNFLKPVATIILPKFPTLLGYFWKGVQTFHFSSEITFGQLLQTFGDLLLVTLLTNEPSIVVQMIILLLNIICSNLVTSKKVLKQDKIHLIFMKANLPWKLMNLLKNSFRIIWGNVGLTKMSPDCHCLLWII